MGFSLQSFYTVSFLLFAVGRPVVKLLFLYIVLTVLTLYYSNTVVFGLVTLRSRERPVGLQWVIQYT